MAATIRFRMAAGMGPSGHDDLRVSGLKIGIEARSDKCRHVERLPNIGPAGDYTELDYLES